MKQYPTKFLRLPAVMEMTGLRRSALYERIARQQFPQQITLTGGRAVAWVAEEVEAYLQASIAACRSEKAVKAE
jgi:prophage regulatory protein